MTIAQILSKMIAASNGNIHDIDHLLRVWAYARTIGELEGLDAETQYLLEVAAITHDIACPLCREKYGNTNGKYQEQEGAVLVRSFLADTGMTEAQIARGLPCGPSPHAAEHSRPGLSDPHRSRLHRKRIRKRIQQAERHALHGHGHENRERQAPRRLCSGHFRK